MRVLIVCPQLPPDKGVGTVRMASLSRYLISAGIEVHALTNSKSVSSGRLEGVEYHFVDAVSEENGFFRYYNENRVRYVSAFYSLCRCPSCKSKENIYPVCNNAKKENQGLTQCGSVCHDKAGDSRGTGFFFDIVVVSGGPFFTFEIAVSAKKIGVPCVLDFRDPWIFDYRGASSFFSIKSLAGRLIQLPQERRAVSAATAVVTVTPGWLAMFRRFYPLCKNKFFLIENGYDDVLLKQLRLPEYIPGSALRLAVFGKTFYYTEKYSEMFVSAMKKHGNVSLLQIGEREPAADALLKKYSVPQDTIETTGFMDYKDGVRVLNTADALLIIDIRAPIRVVMCVRQKMTSYQRYVLFLRRVTKKQSPGVPSVFREAEAMRHGWICLRIFPENPNGVFLRHHIRQFFCQNFFCILCLYCRPPDICLCRRR